MDSFKHKTSFTSKIFAAERETLKSFIAQASLEPLSSLVPDNIDLDKNVDLLAIAFNAAVVNRFNRNGDGIDSKTALAIKDYFIHKPTNIEHNKNKIVGHVINSSFSDFLTNNIIEDKDIPDKGDGPFNISLSAVIYKMVNPSFAELVEESVKEGSEYSNLISASWELGFTDYKIAIGSEDLMHAEIIKADQMDEFEPYLKANGGAGRMNDGTLVYRLVVGEIYPLGIGFTSNPAADVEGLHVKQNNKNEEVLEKNTSQIEKIDVIENKQPNLIMEKVLEKLTDILESSNSNKKFSEEVMANMTRIVNDAILEKNEEWKLERESIENEKQNLADSAKEQEEKINSFEDQLSTTQTELETVKSELAARDASDLFNSRMEEIEVDYDLEAEDKKFLAQEVQALATENDAFTAYKEKVAVIWKHKSHSFKEEQEKIFNERVEAEVQKRISRDENLSEDEVIEEAVQNAEETAETVANNNEEASQEPETLIERFQKAFSDKESDLVEVEL